MLTHQLTSEPRRRHVSQYCSSVSSLGSFLLQLVAAVSQLAQLAMQLAV